MRGDTGRDSRSYAVALALLLLISLGFNGWLYWHLHNVHEVVKENREALRFLFQYLSEISVEVERTFGIR
jgi:hypothetical protein